MNRNEQDPYTFYYYCDVPFGVPCIVWSISLIFFGVNLPYPRSHN